MYVYTVAEQTLNNVFLNVAKLLILTSTIILLHTLIPLYLRDLCIYSYDIEECTFAMVFTKIF